MARPNVTAIPEVIADDPIYREPLAAPAVGFSQGDPIPALTVNAVLWGLTACVRWLMTEVLPSSSGPLGEFIAGLQTDSFGVIRSRRIPAAAWAVVTASGTPILSESGGATVGAGVNDSAAWVVSLDCIPQGARIRQARLLYRARGNGDSTIRMALIQQDANAAGAVVDVDGTPADTGVVTSPGAAGLSLRQITIGPLTPEADQPEMHPFKAVGLAPGVQFLLIEADNDGATAENLVLLDVEIQYRLPSLGEAL